MGGGGGHSALELVLFATNIIILTRNEDRMSYKKSLGYSVGVGLTVIIRLNSVLN